VIRKPCDKSHRGKSRPASDFYPARPPLNFLKGQVMKLSKGKPIQFGRRNIGEEVERMTFGAVVSRRA
jgi:hypothetical protein